MHIVNIILQWLNSKGASKAKKQKKKKNIMA